MVILYSSFAPIISKLLDIHHGDTAKAHNIKGKFNKVWLNSEYLEEHLNILGFNKIKNRFS
jgi:hypothetical protein